LLSRVFKDTLTECGARTSPRNHADVTILDPKKRWTFDASKSRPLLRNTPPDGWQFTGKVVATIVGGEIVYRED
jgi:dihydroorotase-like cyclic amidohydrolase